MTILRHAEEAGVREHGRRITKTPVVRRGLTPSPHSLFSNSPASHLMVAFMRWLDNHCYTFPKRRRINKWDAYRHSRGFCSMLRSPCVEPVLSI